MKKYKLDTEIAFNGRYIEVQLQGDYYCGKELCPELPFKDQMELTGVIFKAFPLGKTSGVYKSINLFPLFDEDELTEFTTQLYVNGEEINEEIA